MDPENQLCSCSHLKCHLSRILHGLIFVKYPARGGKNIWLLPIEILENKLNVLWFRVGCKQIMNHFVSVI